MKSDAKNIITGSNAHSVSGKKEYHITGRQKKKRMYILVSLSERNAKISETAYTSFPLC